MNYRLKIAQEDFEELQRLVLADLPMEAGAFALAGIARRQDGLDVIARRPIAVPHQHFQVQHAYRLEISSQAVNGLVGLCEKNGLGAILCHSHPDDSPYSPSDDFGEMRVFEVLRQFMPAEAPAASLLFYPGGVRGRIWLPRSQQPVPFTEIIVVGRHLRRLRFGDVSSSETAGVDAIYDRQVRAFGGDGQALIRGTKVGIVGVGGTGSPTAEQLARLGVCNLVLIDPDEFEPANITRVYGTFAANMPRGWQRLFRRPLLKVKLVERHLRRINPTIKVEVLAKNVVVRDAAAKLLDRDVIFLCTDDHWGRALVNRIAYQYFIPTVNLGVRIGSENGKVTGAVGTIDVLRPDMPCLWCSQFLRAERIAAESMPRRDRSVLAAQGYVEELENRAPSVVSITSAVSGIAVSLFVQLVTDFMGPPGAIARLNYSVMEASVRRGTATIRDRCVCKQVRGFGDLRSLPTVDDLSFLGA